MSDLSDKLQDLQDELIVTGCYYRQNKFTTRDYQELINIIYIEESILLPYTSVETRSVKL